MKVEMVIYRLEAEKAIRSELEALNNKLNKEYHMEVFNLEPIQAVIMLGMVAGAVELIKRLFDKDWRVSAIIVCAGAIGALTALALAINPLVGAVIGLAASGYITLVQNIGKDSY